MSNSPAESANHAKGLKCPECASDEAFEVDTVAVIRVSRSGDATLKTWYDGAFGWDPSIYGDNEITCLSCNHSGTVSQFAEKPHG